MKSKLALLTERTVTAAIEPMLFSFRRGRRAPNRELLDRLHSEIVAAVRVPVFYTDYGVADTFEGRFELLALHAGLVLRRLNAAEPPGPAVAQDLVDTIFGHLDSDLREAGVGDVTVPKRMKKLAEAFLGRSSAYDQALRLDPDSLPAALARNVFAGRADGTRLAAYVSTACRSLESASLSSLLGRSLPFPDPLSISR